MSSRSVQLLSGLFLLTACEITPSHVESKDIDEAFARNHFKTMCKGLEMKDDDVRRYATEKLQTVQDPLALSCICEHISAPRFEKWDWDPAIAKGLTGTKREDLALCFTALVENPSLRERQNAVVALTNLPARAARDTLGKVAAEADADSETRIHAIKAIAGDPTYQDLFMTLLSEDGDPSVRAAAAEALGGSKDKPVVKALQDAYANDAEGVVRGAALITLKKARVRGIDELLCTAMMEDPSPDVRRRAVGAFKGTKRTTPMKCLRKRALTLEEDSGVRDQILTVLKSSPTDEAAKVLCDAIPFWMRSYVKTALPDQLPGTKIIDAQNDRDWEKSYDCVANAYRRRAGYSCYATMYVAHWFRQLGGSSHIPKCPGVGGD